MARPTKIITVLGATGTQGSSVISWLTDQNTQETSPQTWQIRAVTRNVTSSRAKSVQKRFPAIELVQADLNDVESLRTAFEGSNAIFAVTDFWAPFQNEELRKEHSTGPNPGDSLRRYAYDLEVQQGRNIADAAASSLTSLDHFIWSGLPNCKQNSGGKYQGIYHFDSKAAVTEYVKKTHPDLARKMTVLYIGFYASNVYLTPLMRPIKSDGTYLLERLCSGTAKHPFILTHLDTGRFVTAILSRASTSIGRSVLAYTAMISWSDIADLVSQATTKDVKFKEVTLEELRKRHPIDGEEILSARYSEEFGYAGKEDVLKPGDLGLDVSDGAKRIEKWLEEQDWTGLL